MLFPCGARRISAIQEKRGFMSDGNEERHESRVRLEQERRENLEDQIHSNDGADDDEGEPERPDS
jgi:hypothetical protein